jgi:hypothetical protein
MSLAFSAREGERHERPPCCWLRVAPLFRCDDAVGIMDFWLSRHHRVTMHVFLSSCAVEDSRMRHGMLWSHRGIGDRSWRRGAMSQGDLVQVEYARLRNAAIGVLDAMPDVRNPSARVESALWNLRAVLSGDMPRWPDTERELLDPFEHSLTVRRYTDQHAQPMPLPERAADLRRRLDADRGVDEQPPRDPPHNVIITELRAMIIADLLEELAARLSPGAAFGPSQRGEALACFATDLAVELLDQTFVG